MYKILLVDDDPGLLSAVSRLLEGAGFEVLQASDGREAMNLLRDNHVDLTIIDIFMPNVDGMEFTIRVKRLYPDAKIVAISGGGTVDKRSVLDIARRYGAVRTLTKPFELTDLLATVNEVLELPFGGPRTGSAGEAAAEWRQ